MKRSERENPAERCDLRDFFVCGDRESASELIVRLEPEGSARLIDMVVRGDAEVADGGLVVADELGVILVEKIVDAQ